MSREKQRSTQRVERIRPSVRKRFTHAFTLEGVFFSIADTLYWMYLGAFAVAAGASATLVALITRLPGALSGLLLPFIRNVHYRVRDETILFRLIILLGFFSMLTSILLLFFHPALSILPSILLFLSGQLMSSSSMVLVHTVLPRGDSSYLGYRQGMTFLATLLALLGGSALSSLIEERVFYAIIFSIILLFKLLDVRESFLLPDVKGHVLKPLSYAFPRGVKFRFLAFAFLSMLAASIVGSLLPSYRLDILSIPLSLYPFFFFTFLAGVGVASPLWGVFAEVQGVRTLFLTGMILKSLAVLPWAFVKHLPFLFLAEFLSGIATAAIGLAFSLYTIHLTTSDEERLSYRMQLSTTISLAMLTGLSLVWLFMHTPILTTLFHPLASLLTSHQQEAFAFAAFTRMFAAPFILILLPQVYPKAARPHVTLRHGLRELVSMTIRIFHPNEKKNA